jgi:prophage regulatory protein
MQVTPPRAESAATPRLLRLAATLDHVGLGRSAWLDLVREGKAPRPVKLGRASAWVESELAEWLNERIRQSRGSR